MISSSEEEEDIPRNDKVKRKVTVNQKVFDVLKIACEWVECNEVLSSLRNEFYHHLTNHLKDPDIIGKNDDEEVYKCGWSTCNFETKDPMEITRHVKYHGYHAELRALGKYVSKVSKLPKCMILNEFKVLTNVDDSSLICCWNSCHIISIGIKEFIDHVHYHVKSLSNKRPAFECLWEDCKSVFQIRSKLTDHLKTHTKQHFIACPECGHTFANKTKFVDHCWTQKPIEEHVHQCDYCLSFHPSERILRKHMGQHIHHYKCPFCNMTCNKPSLLAKHIRYRHLNYRSFACTLCDFKCKSKLDLQSHIFTHVKGLYSCQEVNCTYVTSSQLALKKHVESVHVTGKETGLFSCHICDKKYKRGAKLTRHLSSKHNLKKPPGYPRFLYRLESDGFRRLQSVRLESLEAHDIESFEPELPLNDQRNGVEVVVETTVSQQGPAITLDVLSESGQVLSSSLVVAGDSIPPGEIQVLAVGPSPS